MALELGRLTALVVALSVVAACTAPPRPNVLLIVVDTLRADRAGWHGDRGLTPFLDSLAARGHVMRRAYANSSWTYPSMASLWTSRYPSQHRVDTFLSVLRESEQTLAEALSAHGYATAGFSANPGVSRRAGYQQGFQTYETSETSWGKNARTKVRAQEINHTALAWLDTYVMDVPPATRRRPFFLYLHYMEPHWPHEPPADIRKHVLGDANVADTSYAEQLALALHGIPVIEEQLYDGEVMSLDRDLAELFAQLDARDILQHTIVVITADHGEELSDHDRQGHGHTLYEELVHIPLLILLPGQHQRAELSHVVSLIDLAPTLLALVGIESPPSFEGRSFASHLRGQLTDESPNTKAGAERPASRDRPFAYMQLLRRAFIRARDGDPREHHREAIRVGDAKLILDTGGTAEGYNLDANPNEAAPDELSAEALSELRAALASAAQRATRTASKPTTRPLDDATRSRLEALGYVKGADEPASIAE